jgi:putative ABC transport system permease protein
VKQDILYAFRNLWKSPGYATVTVLTLALGIGANTAIFSVVNGVVLKPLPYPQPERLIFITSQFPGLGFDQFWVSAPEFVEFAQSNQSFQQVGGYRAGAVNLGTPDQPRRVNSALVTSELMPVLGVPAIRGRQFTREDTLPGAEDVAILSNELWRTAFNGDDSVIGRVIPIDGAQTRIVGIMPAGYDIHDQRVEVWLPLTLDPANPGNRGGHFLYLVGRLKDDVTLAQARADLETMLRQWPLKSGSGHVPNLTGHRLRFDGLKDDLLGGLRTALWVLQGAVGFVLLIACANLANLMLARAESRQREFAIRSALGAGRWRLLRQFLTEGVMLALIGGAVGAALGFGGLKALLAANPDSLPRSGEVVLDPVVLLFTIVVSIGTGLLFGFAPLLHLREQVVSNSLKEAGLRSTAGAARTWVRRGLVTAEVALAVVLVIGAGLLLRSFWNLMSVDAGFNRSRLVTFGLVLPSSSYRTPQNVVDFFSRLQSQLSAIPGVQSAALMRGLPPQRLVNANDTDFENYMAPPEGPAENVDYYQNITPTYLTTMGIPLVDGRDFNQADIGGPLVVLVNETLAKTYYPSQSPIGRRLKPGFGDQIPWFTIVGVVRDVKQGGVDKKTGTEVYFLADQAPQLPNFGAPRNMNVVLRSSVPLDSLAGNIRRVVNGLDATLPLVKLRTMDEVFAETIARPRFLAQLLAIFAALALALAAIGTYGILSYAVTERRKEIGIHIAMGATQGRVLGMILGQGMQLAAVGLVLGVAASVLLTRLLRTQLFNVRPSDPATVVGVVVFIAGVALLACYIPAHRATRVDPMVVLRDE